MNEALTAHTASIVAAFVARQDCNPSEVPGLIESTFNALAGLGPKVEATPAPLEPAIPIRSAVRPDTVACLECGHRGKMLKRHLSMAHGLSAEEYRGRWNLPANHPLTAPNYAARRRDLAKQIGLGRNGGGRPSAITKGN